MTVGDPEGDENNSNGNNDQQSSIKLKSHDLVVHINSTEDLETMSEIADQHMRQMQKAALVGEMEVLEQEETLFEMLGGR